jgi:hypothetical protein
MILTWLKFRPDWLPPLLWIWWMFATFLLTFDKPYTTTGNGYFSCWVGLLSAGALAYHKSGTVQSIISWIYSEKMGGGKMYHVCAVLMASVAELIAAAEVCMQLDHSCTHEHGWAISVGVISSAVCLLLLCLPSSTEDTDTKEYQYQSVIVSFASHFLVMVWFPGVWVLTSHSPFVQAGNGYFACWAALLFSMSYLQAVRQLHSANDNDETVDVPTGSASVTASTVSTNLDVMSAWQGFLAAITASFDYYCNPVIHAASVVLVVQASQDCYDRNEFALGGGSCGGTGGGNVAFAIAAGVISAFVCGVWKVTEAAPTNRGSMSLFQAAWWTLATTLLTFGHPYKYTGNAFFACWSGMVSAWYLAHKHSATMQDAVAALWKISRRSKYRSTCYLVLVASITELGAAISECWAYGTCNKERGWAVSAGCISIIVCVVALQIRPSKTVALQVTALLLLVLWLAATYSSTFRDPFRSSGNGYFGSWGALFFSVQYFCLLWQGGSAVDYACLPPNKQKRGGGESGYSKSYTFGGDLRDSFLDAGKWDTPEGPEGGAGGYECGKVIHAVDSKSYQTLCEAIGRPRFECEDAEGKWSAYPEIVQERIAEALEAHQKQCVVLATCQKCKETHQTPIDR